MPPALTGDYAFRDGALFLRAPTGGEVRLRWRPVPEAHMRLANGQWHPFIPDFRIIAPFIPLPTDMPEADKGRLQAKQDAFQAFKAQLADDLVKAVEPFTNHQWPMMILLNRSVAARDLARSNPVLAYALANNEHFRQGGSHDHAATEATRYSRRKQREISAWLGFPDSDAMVRMFKKIPVGIVYPGLLRKLRQCIVFPEVFKLFGHLPSLNTGVLFLSSHPETAFLVTTKLLREVAEAPDELMAAPTADKLFELIAHAAKYGDREIIPPLGTHRAIEAWHRRITLLRQQHDERIARQEQIVEEMRRLSEPRLHRQHVDDIERLREEYNRLEDVRRDQAPRFLEISDETRLQKELVKLSALKFPPPPIPGTASIIPLQSFAELEAESIEQRNCVGISGAYANRVLSGEVYIYRVLAPGRHTLSIVRRGSSWQIGEFKMHRNKEHREDALIAVQSWLNANQMSM